MTNLEMMKNAAANAMVEGKEMLMNPPYGTEVDELIEKAINGGTAGDEQKLNTIWSELNILKLGGIYYYDCDAKMWRECSSEVYDALWKMREYIMDNYGESLNLAEYYRYNLEDIAEECGIDIDSLDTHPDDWYDDARYVNDCVYNGGSVGYTPYIYVEYDDSNDEYTIRGYKIGCGCDWVRGTYITDIRYLDTYYDVYGIDNVCWIALNGVVDANDVIENCLGYPDGENYTDYTFKSEEFEEKFSDYEWIYI